MKHEVTIKLSVEGEDLSSIFPQVNEVVKAVKESGMSLESVAFGHERPGTIYRGAGLNNDFGVIGEVVQAVEKKVNDRTRR